MIVCLGFLSVLGILCLKFRGYKKDIFDKLPKKGNELKSLYSVAYGIIVMLDGHKIRLSNIKRRKTIERLNVVLDVKESEIIYNVRRVSLALLVLAVAAVFGVLYNLANADVGFLKGNLVARPGYGQAIAQYSLKANGRALDFNVNPREYSPDEVSENFSLAYEKLLRVMLGENASLECVRKDLNLVTAIDEYAINVSWMSSDSEIVDIFGDVSNDMFEDSRTVDVVLTATFSYLEYESVYEIFVTVAAPDLTKEERMIRDIKLLISENDAQSITKESVELPKEVNGQQIIYEEEKEDYTLILFLLGIVTAAIILPRMDKDLEGKVKERNKQMRLDYSEVVSKLNVLIGAGMSTLRAWEKIVRDYEKKIAKAPEKRRFVYEEMRITYYEIQSGVSESSAYSDFGKRCNIHEYLKLGALLEQNVRKGAKGLGKMLESEAIQAFEQRKNLAKKMGEEAGTKLLIPMILMLAVVMVIVLIPAFTSFGV